MRLAAKLVVSLVACVTVLLGVDGWLLVRRAEREFEEGVRTDAESFGRPLAALLSEVWRTEGETAALRILDASQARGEAPHVRVVWWDAPEGAPLAPHVPLAPGQSPPRQGGLLSRGEADGHRYVYVPLDLEGPRQGALELAEPLSDLHRRTRATILRALFLTLLVASASALVILVLGVRMVGRRLDVLMTKVRRVGEGSLEGDVEVGGHDELTELAGAVNQMCETLREAERRVESETEARIRAVEQLRHADRLRTVGQLASGLAHELGTPLNVVSARAGMIASGGLEPPDVLSSAEVIRTQCTRITALIRQLLDFTRPSPASRVDVDLVDLLQETRDLVGSLGLPGRVEWEGEGPPASEVAHVDPAQMRQVFMNLLLNALQAMPDGGTARVGIRRARARPPFAPASAETDAVVVTVSDEGKGIAQKDLARVFEPFFTTKDVGKGTGLGLSVAHGIVHEHGGWIEVESEAGRGTRFTVTLPRGRE